ncbi:MAG: GFA family protein [Deltaproteobacteria bacterium]|nr:GFA family protein [Deltaproteobacteria bacterium]
MSEHDDASWVAAEGGCDCGAVRYRLEARPLFVHCCHCRWCQRETGASFALNAMIETDRVTVLAGAPELVHTPSASGRGQDIARCPICRVAVWSHYAGAGPILAFVRVGTLDDPDRLPPDVHIFTASKQPWVVLPEGTPAVPVYYDRAQLWPAASLARFEALSGAIAAYRAARAQ